MNYKRIYDSLIETRKMSPRLEGQYYELHHIIPRCKGGKDTVDNLVYLTYEEHFVAHLLLAKIFGGSLWFAAEMMANACTRQGEFRHKNRRTFAIARKMARAERSDPTLREYRVLLTGETFSATASELTAMCNSTSTLTSLLNRGRCKYVKGVELASRPAAPILDFINLETKEVHTMNKYMLCHKFGLKVKEINRIIRGIGFSIRGFALVGTSPPSRKDVDNRRKHTTGTRYRFKKITTGEVFYETTAGMVKKFGGLIGSFLKLGKGLLHTSQGFCLETPARCTPQHETFTLQHALYNVSFTGNRKKLAADTGLSYGQVCRLIRGCGKVRCEFRLTTNAEVTPCVATAEAHKHSAESSSAYSAFPLEHRVSEAVIASSQPPPKQHSSESM